MIFLAGAENPSHLKLLQSCGAPRVAVNISSLARRKTKDWQLDIGEGEWIGFADGAVTEEGVKRVLDNVSKPPLYLVGGDTLSPYEGYLPLWSGSSAIMRNTLGVCVTDDVFRDRKLCRQALATRLQGGVLGVITGSIDRSISKFDFVISSSWWSVMKYGETQVWDGREMHRINADHQREARLNFREAIEALGVDYAQVLAGDPDESTRMAVESWKRYSDSFVASTGTLISMPVATSTDDDTHVGAVMVSQSLAIPEAQERHEYQLIPGLQIGVKSTSTFDPDGVRAEIQTPVIETQTANVRRCDNCVLASSGCPGFQPGHYCAYKIPVQIRSRDQLEGVLSAVLEMQTARVFQARFHEEVSGQELSPEVGAEADRLFRLTEKMTAILDDREQLKMTVTAKAQSGVLSRMFGDRVGQAARALRAPVEAEAVVGELLD